VAARLQGIIGKATSEAAGNANYRLCPIGRPSERA
jgi:hypothetical protein